MADPMAELSSVTTALGELARRVTGIADAYGRAKREDLAGELWDVERDLVAAERRLAKLVEGGRDRFPA